MAYIGPLPAETFTSFATQEFSTSATTSYTLDHPVTNENELALFINNVRQQPGSGKAYTASGTALTLSAATASTDTMYAVFLGRALQTVNPADSSVGASQVADNLISGKTALAEAPADTDEFLVSDAGTLKRIDYSLIKGGGQYTKILHTTASSSANVAFNSTYLTSTYQDYKIVFSNVHCATDAQRFSAAFSADNGSNFKALDLNILGRKDDGSQIHSENSNDGSETSLQLQMNENIGNDAGLHISGEIDIFHPSGTDNRKLILGRSGSNVGDSALAFFYSIFGAMTTDTDAINYVKFSWGSGNIASGEFTLYGRKIT